MYPDVMGYMRVNEFTARLALTAWSFIFVLCTVFTDSLVDGLQELEASVALYQNGNATVPNASLLKCYDCDGDDGNCLAGRCSNAHACFVKRINRRGHIRTMKGCIRRPPVNTTSHGCKEIWSQEYTTVFCTCDDQNYCNSARPPPGKYSPILALLIPPLWLLLYLLPEL